MARKNNSALFYLCSLVEYIGRVRKLTRRETADALGMETLQRIYDYADVFHCEPIEKVAAEFIEECQVPMGTFDNEADCRYRVPDYWTMGEVYERLIEDSYPDTCLVEGAWEVYHSWIDPHLSDYNTDFYYQPRDYIAACYKKGEIL